MKFKRMADEEFIIVGYMKKGPHAFSPVLAKYQEDRLVYQGHVTSGVTAADISELSAVERPHFQMMPAWNGDVVWIKPERVYVVEYMTNTHNSLCQPVLKGYRDDVCPADVQMEN